MKHLREAQEKLTKATLAIMAVNSRISDISSNKATVFSVGTHMVEIGKILGEAAKALEDATGDIIEGTQARTEELVAEGRFE